MVNDAFAHMNELHVEAIQGDGDPTYMSNDPIEEDMGLNLDDMEHLIEQSTKPLFDCCVMNRLQASIMLVNIVNLYGVPHTFLDELLSFVATNLLPQSNCFLRNTYEIKKLIMKMGLEHQAILCCSKGHLVYEGPEHEDTL